MPGPLHAGVRLDVAQIDATPPVVDHVEPIPWKTGRVGAVGAIDMITSLPPTPNPTRTPTPTATPIPRAKDASKMRAASSLRMAQIAELLGLGARGKEGKGTSGAKKKLP